MTSFSLPIESESALKQAKIMMCCNAHNLVPRVFTYARRCDKDPGSGWSRDTPKYLSLGGVG